MSGSKNSIILRQLEELAEVTSAAPNHKLEDANLQTPPRNRLLSPFSSKVILSDSNEVNEVEPSPDQFPKGSFSQPYEEVSPTPGRNVLFLQDCILANLAKNKAVEEALDQPPEAIYMPPCEKGSPHAAKKRSLSPLPMNDILAKNSKLEKSLGQDSRADSNLQRNSSDDSDDSDSGFYTQWWLKLSTGGWEAVIAFRRTLVTCLAFDGFEWTFPEIEE